MMNSLNLSHSDALTLSLLLFLLFSLPLYLSFTLSLYLSLSLRRSKRISLTCPSLTRPESQETCGNCSVSTVRTYTPSHHHRNPLLLSNFYRPCLSNLINNNNTDNNGLCNNHNLFLCNSYWYFNRNFVVLRTKSASDILLYLLS